MESNLPEHQAVNPKLPKRSFQRKKGCLNLTQTPEELRAAFLALKTPRDIARLLNVRYDRLVYHIYKVPLENRYTTFEIPKKSGGTRTISAPITAIKLIQRKLNQVLQAVYEPKPSVHGFTPGKNIVTNAKPHVKRRYVLNIDLKDFFPSINFGRVRGMFMGIPYHLPEPVATVLAQICCHSNQLPQGAPTSPIITNMLCAQMDSRLQRLAQKHKCTYTRYADDITFSTNMPEFPTDLAIEVTTDEGTRIQIGEPLRQIIESSGFLINDKKVRLQKRGHHQEVTGLTTNEFPNVDRRYVRQIRAMLHAWRKYGNQNILSVTSKSNHPISYESFDNFKQVLRGRIEYVGLVKGKSSQIYKRFLDEFSFLVRMGI